MLKGGDFLSKQNKDVDSKLNTKHQPNTTSNQMKQQFNEFAKSSKRKLQALNIKNRLKINEFKTKITKSKVEFNPLEMKDTKQDLQLLSRFTTIFSGVVVTGLSVGLLLLSRPTITELNFDLKLQESIDSAFSYEVTGTNTKNGTISYHTPKQFQYLFSIGANDMIKYKDNKVIMHYNNQYSSIGHDMDTYSLLRDENKAAGEEVFYKNFTYGEQNGFVQLVRMNEQYLLIVFVDGTKLSAIVDYEEAPYMTYNMLMMAKSVEVIPNATSNIASEANVSSSEDSKSIETEGIKTTEVPIMSLDESGKVETNVEMVPDGEVSMPETEQVIDFDFSAEKREEMIETTDHSSVSEGEILNEGN